MPRFGLDVAESCERVAGAGALELCCAGLVLSTLLSVFTLLPWFAVVCSCALAPSEAAANAATRITRALVMHASEVKCGYNQPKPLNEPYPSGNLLNQSRNFA